MIIVSQSQSNLQAQNARLKETILSLQNQIRERCQNYLFHLGNKPKIQTNPRQKSTLSICPQIINQQFLIRYEEDPAWDVDLRNSLDQRAQGRKGFDILKHGNGFLSQSIGSESEELIRLQDQIQFLKRLHEEEQKNRSSGLINSYSLFNTNCSFNSTQVSQVQTKFQEEIEKNRRFEEQIRKYQQKIYVFQNIFSSICDIVIGQDSLISKQIDLKQYDKIEGSLRKIFIRIKELKRQSQASSKQKNLLLSDLKNINMKAESIFYKQQVEKWDKSIQIDEEILSQQMKTQIKKTRRSLYLQSQEKLEDLQKLRRELSFNECIPMKEQVYDSEYESIIKSLKAEGITSMPNSPVKQNKQQNSTSNQTSEQQIFDKITIQRQDDQNRNSMSTITEESHSYRLSENVVEQQEENEQQFRVRRSGKEMRVNNESSLH